MKNKKSDVISAISMAIQRRIASRPAGTVISLVIATEIVQKEKIEEEVRAEEEQEEEMSLLLGKEDSHQKEGDIPLIQKEKERKRETKVIGLETTVLVSQDQTKTDPADLGQDLAQKQNKTHLQEEKSQKEVEDQTKTEEDTTRVTIIKVIELLLLTTTGGLAEKQIPHPLSMLSYSEKLVIQSHKMKSWKLQLVILDVPPAVSH